MSLNTEIPTLDGTEKFGAYVARPAGTPKAAIIVIQEIFGVNKGIRSKCDKWAAAGYLAVAPDLFWRIRPGIELDPDIEAEFNEALEHMGNNDMGRSVRDIEATIHWIRRDAGVAKVGIVGFCMGGLLAYMTAARTDIDASVGYYGVGINQMLGESHAIAKPLLLHVPTEDHFVDANVQKAMHEGLDSHPRVTIHDYVGLDHGFATESGTRRDEEGAQLADSRTAEFFARHLG